MARQPKVVDIDPVGRSGCRRLVVPALFLLALGAMVWYYRFQREEKPQPLPVEATGVRSSVVQEGDSLRVAVTWRLVVPRGPEVAESARVEVGVNNGAASQVATVPAHEQVDTLWVPAPEAGKSTSGYSCVSTMSRGRLTRESCTPWQFVRPGSGQSSSDSVPAASKPSSQRAAAAKVSRIVVQPEGMQVDPDVEGRCAAWQRQNPARSVWVAVNRQAVPDCTGPNGKPIVAQFCAFAVLMDGRRVKTVSSEKVSYCDQLFREWSQEKISLALPPRVPGIPIFLDT